jgi:hypothetical protein
LTELLGEVLGGKPRHHVGVAAAASGTMTVTGRAGHSAARPEIERTAAMHPAASVAANFRL